VAWWPSLGIARARRIIPSPALAVIVVRLVARRGAARGDDASLGGRVHRYKFLSKAIALEASRLET